jgi:uncharacterized C2H2 Zn-finger protein
MTQPFKVTMPDGSRFWQCPICQIGNKSHSLIELHISQQHGFHCTDDNCDLTFPFLLDCERHYVFSHTDGANALPCINSECSYVAINTRDLDSHYRSTHRLENMGIFDKFREIDKIITTGE